MKSVSKKALYESIMTSVAKQVKKTLNENNNVNDNADQLKELIAEHESRLRVLKRKLAVLESEKEIIDAFAKGINDWTDWHDSHYSNYIREGEEGKELIEASGGICNYIYETGCKDMYSFIEDCLDDIDIDIDDDDFEFDEDFIEDFIKEHDEEINGVLASDYGYVFE